MDHTTVAIPIAFVLLSVVLFLALIRAKWGWKLTSALMFSVLAFALVLWSALESFKGFPAHTNPPDKSVLYAAIVVEPEPQHKGYIYLWAVPFDDKRPPTYNPLEYVPEGREPRGYRVPYSRPLHEQVERAKELLKAGRVPVLNMKGRAGGKPGQPGAPVRSDRPRNGSGPPGVGSAGLGEGGPEVYELPPPRPHRKVVE